LRTLYIEQKDELKSSMEVQATEHSVAIIINEVVTDEFSREADIELTIREARKLLSFLNDWFEKS